jgi:hypothetical protein
VSTLQIVVAVPTQFDELKPKISAALLQEWKSAKIKFETTNADQCLVTSVEIPNSQRITDTDSGEEVATVATIQAAQRIVSSICHPEF